MNPHFSWWILDFSRVIPPFFEGEMGQDPDMEWVEIGIDVRGWNILASLLQV